MYKSNAAVYQKKGAKDKQEFKAVKEVKAIEKQDELGALETTRRNSSSSRTSASSRNSNTKKEPQHKIKAACKRGRPKKVMKPEVKKFVGTRRKSVKVRQVETLID